MSKSSETLYTCLIEEQAGEEAFVQVYWARADHIGAAIEKMVSAAQFNGLRNPNPVQFDPFDIHNLKCVVQPSPESEVFWTPVHYSFPPSPSFILPYGVIGSGIKGDHDPEEILAGYTRYKDDTGIITIAVNVERPELFNVYENLLQIRDSYRVFWYKICSHWEESADHLLVNESLNTPARISSHIKAHELDSLMNGYVILTAYHEDGATNLNISDHKRIEITTRSAGVADGYAEALKVLGYNEKDKLVSIENRIHHWHYRHPTSLSKSELIAYLHSIGFTDWTPK